MTRKPYPSDVNDVKWVLEAIVDDLGMLLHDIDGRIDGRCTMPNPVRH